MYLYTHKFTFIAYPFPALIIHLTVFECFYSGTLAFHHFVHNDFSYFPTMNFPAQFPNIDFINAVMKKMNY